MRPRQWVKNFAIFAAILFAGQLFNRDLFLKVFLGFIAFCFLSSATYIINDIFDVKKDRLHHFKKFRPLAHKDIPIILAVITAVIFLIIAVSISSIVTPAFLLLVITYFILQLLYSSFLKSIAVIDIMAIAAGYILRVYAGEFVSGFHISVWILLTAISMSLFLAVGKRRSELTLIINRQEGNLTDIRKSLSQYSEKLLDIYAAVFATSTFISYTLFTFLESPVKFTNQYLNFALPDVFPNFFNIKWLMITILPVVYGIMRYLQDIYEKHEGESPERVLFSDIPLFITVIVWVIMVIFIIYFLGGN